MTVQRAIPTMHVDNVGEALNQEFGYTEKDSRQYVGVAYNTQ